MSTVSVSLEVSPRLNVGSKQSHALRLEKIVPGVIYGPGFGITTQLVQVSLRDLEQVLQHIEESSLVSVQLEGKGYTCLIKNVEYNPIKPEIFSVDFFAPNLKEEIETPVSLHFVGVSESEKGGNTLVKVHSEIEVKALPMDLPEQIEVDISNLKTLDDVIRVSDLVVPDTIEILLGAEEIIALTEAPSQEEELSSEELDALEKSQTESKVATDNKSKEDK